MTFDHSHTFFPALWALAAFYVTLYAALVLHEMGHAFAARRCGWKILPVILGKGRHSCAVPFLGLVVEFRPIPIGGRVDDEPEHSTKMQKDYPKIYARQTRLVALSGPLANVLPLMLFGHLYYVRLRELSDSLPELAWNLNAVTNFIREGGSLLLFNPLLCCSFFISIAYALGNLVPFRGYDGWVFIKGIDSRAPSGS